MSTAVANPSVAADIGVLREQAQVVQRVIHLNTDGLTHEDSLVQPQPGGNCLNWNLGHLLFVYDQMLPLLGQQPVMGKEKLARYDRGSAALNNPAEALPMTELLQGLDEAAKRVDGGLAALPAERLDEPAPFSPRKNPNETVRSLLTIFLFHQAYHCGQTGLLRRIAGKDGAMK